MRDLDDADGRRARRRRAAASIVVLGAGVLGMEFALAAAGHGAEVVVVHHGEHPDGAQPRRARRPDARPAPPARRSASGWRRTRGPRACCFRYDDDGMPALRRDRSAPTASTIPGDLLVLSCGVGPRVELAAAAGLACSSGILVDEELRSWSDPDIFAIGDCAQVASPDEAGRVGRVPGAPSGLIGPGWRQAAALARRLRRRGRGGDGAPIDATVATARTARGRDAEGRRASTSSPAENTPPNRGRTTDAEVSLWLDPARGAYLKTVVRDGRPHRLRVGRAAAAPAPS